MQLVSVELQTLHLYGLHISNTQNRQKTYKIDKNVQNRQKRTK